MKMKRHIKILLFSFLLLTVVSFATCHFGVQHEINKIPPETREKMKDFDWVGIEWIGLGMIAEFFAVVCLMLALVFWNKQRQIK